MQKYEDKTKQIFSYKVLDTSLTVLIWGGKQVFAVSITYLCFLLSVQKFLFRLFRKILEFIFFLNTFFSIILLILMFNW